MFIKHTEREIGSGQFPCYRTFEFPDGKLVYDGWIADNKAIGARVQYRILSKQERISKLKDKLPEEIDELNRVFSDEERVKEQRDINDIRVALGELSAEEHRPEKTFALGIFAESVSLPTDPNNTEAAFWIDYYAAQPDRFREVTGA